MVIEEQNRIRKRYYDGSKDSRIILEGFDLAYVIIDKIKPAA